MAPVMGFPVEAPQPHEHAQVPPGAPQEPSMQVCVQQPPVLLLSQQKTQAWRMCENPACLFSPTVTLSSSSSCRQNGWSRRKFLPNTWSSSPRSTAWCSGASSQQETPYVSFLLIWSFVFLLLKLNMKLHLRGFVTWLKIFLLSANEKETRRRSQTFRIPVRQAERADGRIGFPVYFLAHFWICIWYKCTTSDILPSSPRISWAASTRSVAAWRARTTRGAWRSTPRWSAAATSAKSPPSCPSSKCSWPSPTS